MSREQVSVAELLLSLDSSELQEAEQVRAAVNQQLSSDRGGAVLSCLVEYYLDSSSSQAVLLLSAVREPLHKALLEKLNESLSRPGSRLAAVTLLGHLIRKQPPWVHHVSHSLLLSSLLRCLKTDSDVVVLITGVLVLITLLPMIPQAGKQHIYDFFDVFGRLASWSYKNPGHVLPVYLVHLHAGVYSLFHRLYGMFPCNFISYLRRHYSMKENLDTFQEVVKPMLDQVRVHPELVTGGPDYELEPSRWKCYEVHDILSECSRVSLDPLESSCEEDIYSSSSSPRPPSVSSSLPHLELPSTPGVTEAVSNSGSTKLRLSVAAAVLIITSADPGPLLYSASCFPDDKPWITSDLKELLNKKKIAFRDRDLRSVQKLLKVKIRDNNEVENSEIRRTPTGMPSDPYGNAILSTALDVTWSPSSHCGLSTEPASADSTPSLHRCTSVSGVTCPMSTSLPVAPPAEDSQRPHSTCQMKQPITAQEEPGLRDAFNNCRADVKPAESSQPRLLTSTPSHKSPAISLCFTPSHASSLRGSTLSDPTHTDIFLACPYESLFELALPRAASLFIGRKTQEALKRAAGEQAKEQDGEEDNSSMSPIKALDQMIIHGNDAHQGLNRRMSAGSKSLDRSPYGGKQQSMKTKGSTQGEELQSLRSQLLLVHSQLQYERFKRQQHAMRNRRLLRRVINTTVLEEHSVAMKAQLGVQDEEIRCLKSSLATEQSQNIELLKDTQKRMDQLHAHTQQLLLQLQEEQQGNQRLQTELEETQNRLRDLEAELQRASNTAYNAEHQLTQLSLKLCSSQQLQEHICLLNQQLVLLREANRALNEQLQGGDAHSCTETSMLQSSVGRDFQRLKDSDIHLRQKLEAANHRIADLESQLAKKEQLILSQKKLLEDTKNQSRTELSASESRCVALRRVTQTLQTEILHLYSQIPLDVLAGDSAHSGSHPQDADRLSSVADTSPVTQDSDKLRPSSSAVGILNGAVEALSTSPLPLPSSSSSPLDSPLAVGSFLEQRARQLFGPSSQSQEEEVQHQLHQQQEGEEEEEGDGEEGKLESPPLGQEVEEATPLSVSPEAEPSSDVRGPTAVGQRRHELSIMDYDELLPES
ncbi:TSC complex subunit 1a [Xenentodon cancila]